MGALRHLRGVLFLLAAATALVLLPMRHAVVVVSSPPRGGRSAPKGGPDGSASAAGRPTTAAVKSPAAGGAGRLDIDTLEGGHPRSSSGGSAKALRPPSSAGSAVVVVAAVAAAAAAGGGSPLRHAAAVVSTASPPRVEPIGAEERQRLFAELRVNPDQLPGRRSESLQPPAELDPAAAGGIFRNPYRPLSESTQPCRNFAYTNGRWVSDPSREAPYPGVGEILGSCQRGYEAAGHPPGARRPELQYRWQPNNCQLQPFTEEGFCRALRGRDIMFAGDSLNDHWHASLVYLLGLHGRDIYAKEGTVQRKRACQTHPICGKYYPRPLKIYFLTNQLLQQTSMRNRNHKWWKHVRQYSLLVLNAGSWMRDPTNEEREVSDAEYQQHMVNALKLVKALFNGTVIWRTTYQGHPYCWRYQEPLTEELAPEDFPTVAPYKRYRWAAIADRNAFATRLWYEAGAHILDVTRLTNLMPLGHLGQNHPKFALRNTTDCLHYCAPGPYDTWSELLMNLLLGNIDS